ncbi:arsenate reductase family protein [Paenibacillus nuruki]|uniref:arsenate reductase family protein n=1 Tax=Paenibacillus nuruki TaxID=1886670 RepID=UPI0028053A8E|nr:arsenate reductase family protein [Paenibacillus nuruki]CAJ1316054.1 Arsenate reductase (Glutaredoxin) [Paenibacillus nuruki]
MSKLTVYQYPQCSTCRNAIKWLRAEGHELNLIHIVESPPTAEQLRELVEHSELELKKFFNTSGEVYKSQNLKEKLPSMDAQEQLQLLSENGKLIKRPIVTDGDRVTVGFKEATYEETWKA